jgi:aromatic-L-amino-acid decarboxylase
MINIEEFRHHAHKLVDWMADYYTTIEDYPVKSKVKPGDILQQIPDAPPEQSETITDIFEDFKDIILPGITHWQSPKWFAYFQANSSYPSVLAEMLTATLATQCMVWETSPAATELEEKMMIWLKNMMGLPDHFEGVIQDTASTATLCAFLTAREKASLFRINKTGFEGDEEYRIYCSTETHSSIDKAIRIAGIGDQNLIKVDVDQHLALRPELLEEAIRKDLQGGKKPLCVVATIGTTGTMAIDPLQSISEICRKYDIWLHVDAAYAGSALVLPEYRWMIEGLEHADSYVFNPHKWLFTNFDFSAYYVKDRDTLIRTFSILPEYLKTNVDDKVNNYRDWGIQLGRRFRALKIWFVLRNFGTVEIQKRIKKHISMVQELAEEIKKDPDFEIMVENPLNMICFRFHPRDIRDETSLNMLNEKILKAVNDSGETHLTHTKIKDTFLIRLVGGQTYLEKSHLDVVWDLIKQCCYKIYINE